ncbi:uncharacterized protein LOC143611121 [Bidens hawaiensis]|uniref:uncharacterized protein LOC143611121 n=1 Tax=Bidens hawaiensis TaxID=980011 RepID=UPI004049A8D1
MDIRIANVFVERVQRLKDSGLWKVYDDIGLGTLKGQAQAFDNTRCPCLVKMGDESTSETKISKLEVSNPLYLHPSDASTLSIINVKLKGTENYRVWASAMKLALQVKNKVGFINGKCLKPVEDEVLANQWDRCNSIVLTWILNSVCDELYVGQVYFEPAFDVWEELRDTYDKVDGSVVFGLYQKINLLSQNGLINLLTSEPLPSVKAAFAIISREESHRNANGSKGQIQNLGFAAKVNQFFDNKKGVYRGPNPNFKCTHCNKIGHTVERCFEIMGYPQSSKPKNNKFVNQGSKKFSNSSNNGKTGTSSDSNMSTLTSNQISRLLGLLEKADVGPSASIVGGNYLCNFSKGVFCFTSGLSTDSDESTWVVDSGANQHMIMNDKNVFNQIDVTEFNIKIKHPNGSNALVTKIGSVKLSNNVILNDVFVVPEYNVNLLSVYKLAYDNKLSVTFNEHCCYIQDSLTKRILVTGNQLDGLYFCGNATLPVKVRASSFPSTRSSKG